ncbi:hypothetical protein KFU94_56665 [Chloroflexi bacterium TSY]|nr:hypothetical protein [Chloroflexi bacterium TSY]
MSQELFYWVYVEAAGAGYDLSHDLTSLTVEEGGDGPAQLTIQMSDPNKVFSYAVQKGMDIEVDLGYVDDHSIVFRGHIYKVEGDFPQDGVPTLRILAYDRSMKMGLRKRNRTWNQTTLESLVNTIGQEYSEYFMTQDIHVTLMGDPEFTDNGIRQQDETDLAFLRRLATRYGCALFVVAGENADGLHFEAQHHIMTQEPEVTLYHGRCGVPEQLLSFQASSDVSNMRLPRVFSGIDFSTGQPLSVATQTVEEVGNMEDPFVDEHLAEFRRREPVQAERLTDMFRAAETLEETLRDEMGNVDRELVWGFTTEADLRVREENQFSTSLHGMRASGSALGNHRIHAQSVIRIADVGGQFSGTWYLSQVRHIFDNQGYRTEFECQR